MTRGRPLPCEKSGLALLLVLFLGACAGEPDLDGHGLLWKNSANGCARLAAPHPGVKQAQRRP